MECTTKKTGEVRIDKVHNTLTNYWRSSVAQWVTGTPTTSVLLPNYIALGNGTAPSNGPQATDVAGWAEIAGTRKSSSARSATLNYYAQYIAQYLSTDPVGPYTECMLFDTPPSTTSLSAAVVAGATSLPLSAGAPVVNSGQMQAYIDDSTNPEYVTLSSTYSAGAASWTITNGLQYAHASGTPIIYFNGNLFAHAQLSNVNKSDTEAMTIQWMILNS